MEKGIYYVHIGNDNYAPTHSDFIRHNDKVHKPELGPVQSFSSPPNGCDNPNCKCTQNLDDSWNIVCN